MRRVFNLTKHELRQKVIRQLQAMNNSDKIQIENNMYKRVFQSRLWKNADVIGITCSESFEWNTFPIIEMAWSMGKKVTVPKSFPKNKQLKFYLLENFSDLKRGYANILEPDINKVKEIKEEHIDLLFVPGIVFDEKGYRIGFGGGFYDRFLQGRQFITVSLATNFQLVEKVPIDHFDIPVQNIVTDSDWIHIL